MLPCYDTKKPPDSRSSGFQKSRLSSSTLRCLPASCHLRGLTFPWGNKGKGLSMSKDTMSVSICASGPTVHAEAAQAALGNVAFFRTPPSAEDVVSSVFGETAQVDRVAFERRKRYVLQHEAQRLMSSQVRINRKKEEVKYRVCHCMWSQRANASAGARLTTKGASYTGLQICASTWHCPVCAARITNEWRKRLQDAIGAAGQLGYQPVLVTYTARHHAHTILADQLEAMSKAYEAVWRGAPSDRLKARFDIFGMIRSLEVTHSKQNGWHPHIHAIIFLPIEADISAFSEALGARWAACAARHGLSMNGHGFHCTDEASRLAEYVAKFGMELDDEGRERLADAKLQKTEVWTEADELARWHTKKGRSGVQCMGKPVRGLEDHLTPFQLLEASREGDAEAGALFIEYALAYHGRQQCTPTTHLWEKLGLNEMLTDEEAASKQEDEAKLILDVFLSPNDWKTVRSSDTRAEFLEVLEKSQGDPQVFYDACVRLWGIHPSIYFFPPEFVDSNTP